MPFGPSSIAAHLVMPRIAHLVAAYAVQLAMPARPSTDEALMIEPPPFLRIVRVTACIPRKQPSWLIRQSSSTSSAGCRSMSPKRRMPALLASTLTAPKRSFVSSTTRAHDAASLTSWSAKWVSPPSSSASAWPSSFAMSAITTFAPSATKWRTMAAPCPCAPPVTMATLPSNLPLTLLISGLQLHDRVGGEAHGGVAVGEVAPELLVEVVGGPEVAGLVEALLDDRSRDQRHHAAVHDEDLSGDAGGGVRGEVGDDGRHVLGRVRVDVHARLVRPEDLGGHRRASTGADRVGAYAA